MEDITDDSEHDLQSVFNKISESLKSINQRNEKNESPVNNMKNVLKEREQKENGDKNHVSAKNPDKKIKLDNFDNLSEADCEEDLLKISVESPKTETLKNSDCSIINDLVKEIDKHLEIDQEIPGLNNVEQTDCSQNHVMEVSNSENYSKNSWELPNVIEKKSEESVNSFNLNDNELTNKEKTSKTKFETDVEIEAGLPINNTILKDNSLQNDKELNVDELSVLNNDETESNAQINNQKEKLTQPLNENPTILENEIILDDTAETIESLENEIILDDTIETIESLENEIILNDTTEITESPAELDEETDYCIKAELIKKTNEVETTELIELDKINIKVDTISSTSTEISNAIEENQENKEIENKEPCVLNEKLSQENEKTEQNQEESISNTEEKAIIEDDNKLVDENSNSEKTSTVEPENELSNKNLDTEEKSVIQSENICTKDKTEGLTETTEIHNDTSLEHEIISTDNTTIIVAKKNSVDQSETSENEATVSICIQEYNESKDDETVSGTKELLSGLTDELENELKDEEKISDIPEANQNEITSPDEKSESEKEPELIQQQNQEIKNLETETIEIESMIIDIDDSDDEVQSKVEDNECSKSVDNSKIEQMEVDDDECIQISNENKNDASINSSKLQITEQTENAETDYSDLIINLDDEDSNLDTLEIDEKEEEKLLLGDDIENENKDQTDKMECNTEEENTKKSTTKSKNDDIKEIKDSMEENSNKIDDSIIEQLESPKKMEENKDKSVQNSDVDVEENKVEDEISKSQDGNLDVEVLDNSETDGDKFTFYNKECINYQCKRSCNLYYISPIFALNYYRVTVKPNSSQYVCDECYDKAVNKYEEWCNVLVNREPLLQCDIPRKTNEFVEILDSSDEEGENLKHDDKKNEFDEESINMFEKELNSVIASVFERTQIQNQFTWSQSILQQKMEKLKEDCDWMSETLSSLQKNADEISSELYQCPKIEMKHLTSFDCNTGKPYILGESSQANQITVPPIGEIYRAPIIIGCEYYAAKNKVIASWLPSKVVEAVEPPTQEKARLVKYYKVKFFKMKLPTFKTVLAKHLAYSDVPKVQLSIGTRVIALFDASTLYRTKEIQGSDIKSAFYPGVIAEALQPYNNYRYLIFFDDGYTQYVHHRDVRLICEVSANVWDDIHPGSRDFIQNYLINYKKNRPMVQVKKGQSMVTELNGKWIYAKVVDVDASLIQMLFEGQKNHTEWIYRGSTRLGPLFKAIQKTSIPQVTRLPRRSEPFVRYMQDDENAKQNQQNNANESTQTPTHARSQVARKSTTRQESVEVPPIPTTVKHLNNSTIFVDDEEPKGTLVYYSSKSENNPPPKTYKPHFCGPHCIIREHFDGHYGVLSKPLLNSWERSIYKIKNKKTCVVYRAPCGRNLRNIEEVHRYLRITRNELNVENFVFDPDVGCLNEYQVKKCIVNKPDITEGREKIPIQCVNYYDHTMPPYCEYAADRLPTEGVNLNTDPEFLVGCDCKDDCNDKSKCSCWRLTLEGARYGNPHTPMENIGYHYKRLLEPVTTGIYECNSRCKCSSKCINRVVQHPLETKLQVFKTSNRGWGLRCINDVPKGAFICIYAGNLLTEQKANECGDGDEYFAELDYIEVAERLKEGYESDVQDDIDSDDYVPEHDSDEEFNPRAAEVQVTPLVATRNRTATKRSNSNTTNGTNDEDDEQERQTINFVPNTLLDNYEDITTKYVSMRKLFGKNEYCYIMDAKSIGNVGRYFNHSCAPNLFVQNVFVDTHDLRFPWVAFFALTNIRAGTELTWNYNYEVGVVPGKVLFCQCGAANCRGRLL